MYWVKPDRGQLRAPVLAENKYVLYAYNHDGYGVFWTPNQHIGARKKENTTAIRFWFCEIDHVDKDQQAKLLREAPLRPTVVVESGNSFQAYWKALDGSLETWDAIVKDRLVPYLGADTAATDPLRLLRVPGWYHHKGAPFLVSVVSQEPFSYTASQMLRAFPPSRKSLRRSRATANGGEGYRNKLDKIDGRFALERLSGHWLVCGEHFRLHEQSNGKANISVRREGDTRWSGTAQFIDTVGKFGNVSAGPTLAHYCMWYGHSWTTVMNELEKLFPEELGEHQET